MKTTKFDPAEDVIRKFGLFEGEEDEGARDSSGGSGGGGDGDGSGDVGGDAGSAASGVGGASGDNGSGSGSDRGSDADGALNWRDSIEDPGLRKLADRFAAPVDAIRAVADLRKRESNSIRLPSENASDEELATYRKSIGVPDDPSGYAFVMPEGQELTDVDKAFHQEASEVFHGMNLTAHQAAELNKWWNERGARVAQAMKDEDKDFADRTDAQLKKEWPGDEYAANREFANRAAPRLFGDNFEDVRNMRTESGHVVLDHPAFVQVFARLGREMHEGNLGAAVGEAEIQTLNDQIADAREKAQAAHAKGNRSEANRWSAKELELIERRDGAQPIVGSMGRVS